MATEFQWITPEQFKANLPVAGDTVIYECEAGRFASTLDRGEWGSVTAQRYAVIRPVDPLVLERRAALEAVKARLAVERVEDANRGAWAAVDVLEARLKEAEEG